MTRIVQNLFINAKLMDASSKLIAKYILFGTRKNFTVSSAVTVLIGALTKLN
jgi:hypothetical protein